MYLFWGTEVPFRYLAEAGLTIAASPFCLVSGDGHPLSRMTVGEQKLVQWPVTGLHKGRTR